MLGGVPGGGVPRLPERSKSAADTTLSLKDPPLDVAGQKKKKIPSNCEDFYQWERADEVARLSDSTDLIRPQMLAAALNACRLTGFAGMFHLRWH